MGVRDVIAVVGCVLMFLGLFSPLWIRDGSSWSRVRPFDLGLFLAVASHVWPAGLH